MAVFTNFAATLARQPSAASLAPRSNKRFLKSSFYDKRSKKVLFTITQFICSFLEGNGFNYFAISRFYASERNDIKNQAWPAYGVIQDETQLRPIKNSLKF